MSCPLARPIRELAGILRPPQPLPPTPGAASSAAALFKQCSRLFRALAFRLCTHSMPPFFFFSSVWSVSSVSSFVPLSFRKQCYAIYLRFKGPGSLEPLTAGSRTAEGRAWANSRDFPGAWLPVLGPPPCFEGWNWKEWVLYLVRCFLFNLERWLQSCYSPVTLDFGLFLFSDC